jgi:putative tryptophan/tyrosine transport system substrate-binding protein
MRRRGLRVLEAANESNINAAYATLAQEKPDVLIVNPDPYLTSRREQIVALLSRLSMPSMHSPRDWVMSGALMSYATNVVDSYRRAGVYAGRILKPMADFLNCPPAVPKTPVLLDAVERAGNH